MLRIGLTGGIGSGKSTVLQMLAGLGAASIDADAISRGVTAPGGAAIPLIRQRFGPPFIAGDGGMDRARMREHAYAHPAARKQLEEIIHPLVGQESERQALAAESSGARCLVFDIPLLVESGRWRSRVHRVLVVDCRAETQVQRVTARSGLQPDEVRAIIAAQAPRALRLAAADIVICNEGLQLPQLQAEVEEVARTFGL
ncbi:dephospho-CoA kinase [Ramlibacter tataouinensis]|uniref:Dephospho-CoA kinase n=1 Tax=Ramlibacter tataouinensis (strain ATCC BAA-407 / DSM 14655 / LMG 21543 / TTB310) TaxID=365046 RepID=F5Y6E6_RAMTT|nr:dephospho-CoA kinase [Ramlibacter tataouinensis]AEG94020.1 candidate dephospho-CoA kinase (Dephosphocoenzyme A kinase) [Ramlibacter tataouinensis TTB310]